MNRTITGLRIGWLSILAFSGRLTARKRCGQLTAMRAAPHAKQSFDGGLALIPGQSGDGWGAGFAIY
jgi:hypothetical protein